MHQLCPSAHSIEREAAGIAEHIQHVFVPGVFFQQTAVFALVDEETGFLSFQPIDVEFQSVFHCDEILSLAVEVAVPGSDSRFVGKRAF